MISQEALLDYLNQFLDCKKFSDYTVNGLQVEGRRDIHRIVTAVTASQAAIDFAVATNADALMVHHGYFWKGEDAAVVGMKKRRLQALLQHDINLFAYHLPLDQHAELGNNRLLGGMLPVQRMWQSAAEPLLWHGECAAHSVEAIGGILTKALDFPCRWVGEGAREITRIAWCSGAAQDFLMLAVREGAQLFCSGEYAERTYHEARENDCVYMVCGHHASERAGIRALGEHVADAFSLSVQFYDEENPF